MQDCDPNADTHSQGRSAIPKDTACYRLQVAREQKGKKASVQLFLDQFFKNVDKMPSSNTSSKH
jgi:uncharacterized protein YdaU (DUF1376 family)